MPTELPVAPLTALIVSTALVSEKSVTPRPTAVDTRVALCVNFQTKLIWNESPFCGLSTGRLVMSAVIGNVVRFTSGFASNALVASSAPSHVNVTCESLRHVRDRAESLLLLLRAGCCHSSAPTRGGDERGDEDDESPD